VRCVFLFQFFVGLLLPSLAAAWIMLLLIRSLRAPLT
jgi:hypothetical protein